MKLIFLGGGWRWALGVVMKESGEKRLLETYHALGDIVDFEVNLTSEASAFLRRIAGIRKKFYDVSSVLFYGFPALL